MLLRISREQIESIKSKVSLAALVAERGIHLQRRGQHLFALCPFHDERTPSFVVTPARGLFHCFGCEIGGDVIGFVVRYDRVSFPDALRMLARRADVDLVEAQPLPRRSAEDLCGRTSWQ